VAEKMSFTVAGEVLHMSKGAVSYQISKLEEELDFKLFERRHTHISLTPQGEMLWRAAERRLRQLETVISNLRGGPNETLCVGAHSIFISRWLGPRLSNFTKNHPDIALKVEPINTKPDLLNPALDLSIFWCDLSVEDIDAEVLFVANTRPIASPEIASQVEIIGLERAVREIPLLPDASGMEAWRNWHDVAGLPFTPKKNTLSLPDANSRLQAVIASNGLALMDTLAEPEIESGHLVWISEIALTNFTYCISRPTKGQISPAAEIFINWIRAQDFLNLDKCP
jgi:LysR family glycine cleavage system transcriptional activator